MGQPPVFPLSLTSVWGPSASPSRLFPNLSPCAFSTPASRPTGTNTGRAPRRRLSAKRFQSPFLITLPEALVGACYATGPPLPRVDLRMLAAAVAMP
jgi:hypothetical protein